MWTQMAATGSAKHLSMPQVMQATRNMVWVCQQGAAGRAPPPGSSASMSVSHAASSSGELVMYHMSL